MLSYRETWSALFLKMEDKLWGGCAACSESVNFQD